MKLNLSLDTRTFQELRIEFRVSSFEGLSTYICAVLCSHGAIIRIYMV